MDILSATILLFLIMDPLGNVPIFLSYLERCENRYRVLARELIMALVVLFLFLFLGEKMLRFLHLEQSSVSLAGAIILFIIALRMIFPVTRQYGDEEEEEEPFLVPLAIPLVAGPSILATLILMASKHPNELGTLSVALLVAWILSSVILFSATAMQKYLGKNGMIAIERLMGMLLIAISVQMFLDGIRDFVSSV